MTYIAFISQNFRFLLFTILLTGFSSFGQTFYISLFGGEIRQYFNLTSGQFGTYYGLATLASGFTILWLGSLVDRYDLRKFAIAVIVLLAVACLFMAFATSWPILLISFYLLRLTGQGFMTHTALTATGRYFDANRGKAISVTESGFPVGQALFPIIAVTLIGTIGWRETWFGSAALLIIVLTPLVYWLLRDQSQRHKKYLGLQNEINNSESKTKNKRHWTRKEILSDPRFYIILPMLLSAPFILTGLFFHQVHLATEKGWTMEWMATGLVCFAITQIAGNLIAGVLVDKYSSRTLYGWAALPLIFGLFVLASGDNIMNMIIYLSLAGLTAGMGGTFANAIWPELYGTKHLGSIRSLAGAIMIFGTAASPALYGWLIDQSITMNQITISSAIYTIAALLLILGARKLNRF